ncbi:neuropeptide Y receptor type 4-like [Scleropages formosus]|uniref:Neuropeptide Y receptor type 4-like n=1 Tax=Scleropages formosus TaxID=113540 RepID=A0A0P7UM78_SCLFO|nr:neuropeptide Y receptor type 4-like [Scleropages formosus]KPP60701.1 neuropeptide Y receptor type 4-like [Scleropages formosus]
MNRSLATFSLPPDDPCHTSKGMTIFLITSYCLVMLLGLLGNVGLICIIVRQKEKANVTSILIANLSVSDILVCAFCLPFTVVYTLMDHWIFGAVLCRLTPFIQCMSVTVSILSLVLIALERHQLIINPSGWKPTVPQAYLAVVIIWMLACFTSLPFLAFHLLTSEPYKALPPPLRQPEGKEACTENWPSQQHKLAYTTWLLIFQYCAPLLFVLVCYLRIFIRLRRRRHMLDRGCEENRCMSHSKRINAMLVALVTAFAVCWLPLNTFNVVADWHNEAIPPCHHNLVFSLCHLVAMASTCVNPVIYGFLNSNFRKEVKAAVLHCGCRPVEDYEQFPLSTMQTEVSRTSLRLSCTNTSA